MCLLGSGLDVELIQASREAGGGKQGDGQLRGTHAVLAVEQLPACLAEPSSSLERWLGWAGRWAC